MTSPIPATKRAYATPVVTVFGTLADLTLFVGNRGLSDGGTGSKKKTNV